MYKEQLERAILQAISDKHATYEYCEFVKKRKKAATNICLYGTGNFYEDYVQHVGKYDYVCDKNADNWGRKYNGRECISPQKLSMLESAVVFVMLGNYKNVLEQLRQQHIESYFFGDLYMNVYDKKYNESWFLENREEILNTVDLFEDNWSKQVYVNAICNRVAPQYANKTFHDLEERGEYFETGILKIEDDECYVDVGAYDGDSIIAFINVSRGRFERIDGFELDPKNYANITSNPNIVTDNRINVYNMGISCVEKNVDVVSAGYGSRVDAKSEKQFVKLGQLDNILQDKRVSFIKMDIEGAEMDALKGARKIISSQHPKLAISVYHRLDDMWRIPQYIKFMCPGYKLFLRHHTAVAWDTDCYAYVE